MTDPAVEAIVKRVSEDMAGLAHDMAARYRDEIVDYSTLADDVLFDDVALVSSTNLRALLANLEKGQLIGPDELEEIRQSARRRVHQGVSLESLLHAYRLWGEMSWRAILDATRGDRPEEREAALRITGRVIDHINVVSTAIAQAYLDEAEGVAADREIVRRDLLDALLAGSGGTDAVRGQAESLGIDLLGRYLVAVIRRSPGAEALSSRPVSMRAALREIVDGSKVHLRPAAGTVLVGVRRDEAVILYPAEGPGDLPALRTGCRELVRALRSGPVSIGVGAWHPDLAGVAAGYAEAHDALEAADHAGGGVVAFDDILLDHVLAQGSRARRALIDLMQPLRDYDRAHGARMSETLAAYLDSGFNLTRSASALCVHPNTVVYRLRRIGELTGRNPENPDDLLLLFLALKAGAARN